MVDPQVMGQPILVHAVHGHPSYDWMRTWGYPYDDLEALWK